MTLYIYISYVDPTNIPLTLRDKTLQCIGKPVPQPRFVTLLGPPTWSLRLDAPAATHWGQPPATIRKTRGISYWNIGHRKVYM